MYKYKNKSDLELTVIGHGIVAPGGEIETLSEIENVNFELISKTEDKSIVGTEPAQPNAITEAQQVQPAEPETEVN